MNIFRQTIHGWKLNIWRKCRKINRDIFVLWVHWWKATLMLTLDAKNSTKRTWILWRNEIAKEWTNMHILYDKLMWYFNGNLDGYEQSHLLNLIMTLDSVNMWTVSLSLSPILILPFPHARIVQYSANLIRKKRFLYYIHPHLFAKDFFFRNSKWIFFIVYFFFCSSFVCLFFLCRLAGILQWSIVRMCICAFVSCWFFG